METATGSVVDRAHSTRDGWWTLRARDSAGGVAVEAWYDSLAVTRRSAAGELVPDTDGLLGGRYRGLLSPSGDFTSSARPFVPDEVADVADLSAALDDFFQPLPSMPLAPGHAWRGADLVLRRLPDSVGRSRPLARFTVASRRQVRRVVPRGDTLPVAVRQLVVEQGQFAWDRDDGLVRRTRDITVETTVPAGGRVRQAVRSRLVQHVELVRLPASTCP